MSTAAKMSSLHATASTTFATSRPAAEPPQLESSLTDSNPEVERLFSRCLSSPKGATESTATSSSTSSGKKKTKKKKAGSGAIKAKKVGSYYLIYILRCVRLVLELLHPCQLRESQHSFF